MYLKAASQEGTANIASSPPLRPSSGRLSQSRGQWKCTALCHERPLRVRATVISRVSRILFPKPQGRFTRSRFNDGLLSPSPSSTTTTSSSSESDRLKLHDPSGIASFSNMRQQSILHTYIYVRQNLYKLRRNMYKKFTLTITDNYIFRM